MCAPKLSDFTGRGIKGTWAWDTAPEVAAGEGKAVYPVLGWVRTRIPGVPGRAGAASWVCWAISSCRSAKGEWRKVNRVAWGRRGWKAEHSIRAESERKGGGLRGGSPAGVLGERGAAFARLLVLGSGWCWETGLLLFYLGCRVPQGSLHPHFTSTPHPTAPSLSIPLCRSGAGRSCLASVQLTDAGKPIKALGFFFSLPQGNQLIWLWSRIQRSSGASMGWEAAADICYWGG